MDTLWMLTGRYEALPIIPVDKVVTDFFGHLTLPKFLRKVSDGSIKLPITRMEDSQKAAKGVHVRDLATYLDNRHADGLKEFNRLHS